MLPLPWAKRIRSTPSFSALVWGGSLLMCVHTSVAHRIAPHPIAGMKRGCGVVLVWIIKQQQHLLLSVRVAA